MAPKFHTLQVADVRKETDDCVSVSFKVPEELKSVYAFDPGQYLTLRTNIGDEDIRRSYSICTAPHENDLRVAVKKVAQGKFSTYANDILKPGDSMDVMTPMGRFTTKIDANNKKTYVFFAAGSGITPVMSLVKTILKEEKESEVILFYGNKGMSSIIFREELEGLKNSYIERFRFFHVLSRENSGIPIQFGRMDKDKVIKLCQTFISLEDCDSFFVCGPESMINGVKDALTELKIPQERIHFELFTTPGSAVKPAPIKEEDKTAYADSRIELILDGEVHEFGLNFKGKPILDAAQQAGVDVPFACKGGVCCTCRAKVMEGEVIMDVNYALEKDEVEAGYVLTCQSHPKTKKVVVSFDE